MTKDRITTNYHRYLNYFLTSTIKDTLVNQRSDYVILRPVKARLEIEWQRNLASKFTCNSVLQILT